MFLLNAVLLLAAASYAVAEVVDFKPCANDTGVCTINEVRIDPCQEAASHLACHIKRRKPATMSFDYTPNFDADSFEAGLSWVKSDTQDLPLISMDREACKYTTCPARSGQRQTYTILVPIESKFPTNPYTIKWTLTAPSGDQCCFTTDIKVVRR